MDSYQHHNPYMRPPPPPPPPPSNFWYSNQFQYYPPQSPSPPLPPPPQLNHQQWALPPPQQHHPSYPPPPQQPYHPHPLPPPYPSQDYANTKWSHHSGWEHQGHNIEEYWAARARAWASARSAMDNQHPPSQLTEIPQAEEHSHYPNQYSQPVESHYQDGQQTSSLRAPSYQAPAAPLGPPTSMGSYALEGHFTYPRKDGALRGDMDPPFSCHEGPSSSSVHQQEVPSSYSSVPAMEDRVEGQQLGPSLYPGDGRDVQMEQAQYTYNNHSLDPINRPPDFVPRSSLESDSNIRSGYPDRLGPVVGADSVGEVTSLHAWEAHAPVSPGMAYPPIPPTFPSALQHDPSVPVPPLPGQSATIFERGPNFQQAVPSVSPPVGLGATTFPLDGYGPFFGSEHSKKAAVPNWLREEIIKKKVTVTSLVPEHSKEGRQSTEDESIYSTSSGKDGQEDGRSMDSSKSTEEDDDEDYEEAERVASINQEIKPVLTEVLLKVTDDLFDEIATEVLNEDDAITADAADAENDVPSGKTSPPPVPTPKASIKLLVPMKGKESERDDSNGESSSGLPGNLSGLANYASDDNEDEYQISSVPPSHNSADKDDHPQPEVGERSRKQLFHAEGDNTVASKSGDSKIDDKDLGNGEAQRSHSEGTASFGKKGDSVTDGGESPVVSDTPDSLAKSKETSVNSTDFPSKRPNSEKSGDARSSHEHESSSSGRDKERVDEKAEGPGRQEDREDHNGSKERLKEQSSKHREKAKECDSRKRSSYDDKDSKQERKASDKDVSDKKRENTKDEKSDESRQKSSSDRGRHKRRRYLSVSVDNVLEDSRSKKVHSKRPNFSPSPDSTRGRHVSKSPSSKRSQRRHSPYSSLDGTRGRRSSSRSPVRRHR